MASVPVALLISGLLGSPASAAVSPPVDGAVVGSVDAGRFHTCGVKTDGTAACWGNDFSGEATPPIGTFTQVSTGEAHTCGVKTDGTAACWGSNGWGQATPPAGTFTQVSAGELYSCGVRTDGTVVCWGNNGYGRAAPPGGTFAHISAGTFHACGVRTDGTAACWGDNGSGQAAPPAGAFTQVSSGGFHSCGVNTDGTAVCWGSNSYGQRGAAADITSLPPPDGALDQPYSHAYTATGSPAPQFQLISGALPPGLSLNGTTGQVTGSPTSTGVFTGTVRADNSFFAPDTQTFSITIAAPPATAKQVALSASRTRARPGQRVALMVTVSPCAGHAGELVHLAWGSRSLGR